LPCTDQQGGRRRMPSSRAAAALEARQSRPRRTGVHACLLATSSAEPQVSEGWHICLGQYSEEDRAWGDRGAPC
jgi:hypothetical protein